MFKALDKIVDKILPLEIEEEEFVKDEEDKEMSELRRMLEDDDEYDEQTLENNEKVVNINKAREYRRRQRVPKEQLAPRNSKKNKGKNKDKSSKKGEHGDEDPRS